MILKESQNSLKGKIKDIFLNTINGLVNNLSKLISTDDKKSLGYFSLLNTTTRDGS